MVAGQLPPIRECRNVSSRCKCRAASSLLQRQPIRQLYDTDEFWSISASLVGGLPLDAAKDRLASAIKGWIERVLDPPESLVVFPVANLDRMDGLVDIGPTLLGHHGERFADRVRAKARRAVMAHTPSEPWWMSASEADTPDSDPPILFAYLCRSQLGRAVEEAGETFEDLAGVALMVQPDLDKLSLYSLRGDANRPGIRGLVVDRKALAGFVAGNPQISREIGSPIIVDGVFGQGTSFHWYSEDPFPLEKLLSGADKLSAAEYLLRGTSAVHSRLRVAARWHAKAHWSIDPADAVLALGVSFDSMLSEQGPTPGRVLSERFALLDPDPTHRRDRYRHFQNEYYPARSSVAHGSKSKSFDTEFVRRMAAEARWAFLRIVELARTLPTGTEAEYNDMYEGLKWGKPSGA